MYRVNPVETGRVALIQANDTVRSVAASPAPSTTSTLTGFAPSTTMAKQPVRVLARPPSSSISSMRSTPVGLPMAPHSVPGRSYNDLVELAEHQRRQIEANRKEEERRNALLARGHHMERAEVSARVRSLRREVAEEELELKRLSELERETRTLRVRNAEASRTVEMLARTVEEDQASLRRAATQVDSLRAQLEELRRRRRIAQNAAAVEQQRMNKAQAHSAQLHHANRSSASATPVPSSNQEHSAPRPRASVEPFQIQQLKIADDTPAKKDSVRCDETDSRLRFPSEPPTPYSTSFTGAEKGIRLGPQVTTTQRTTMTSLVGTSGGTTSFTTSKREDISPSPPKDPHPTTTVDGGPERQEQPKATVMETDEDVARPRLRGGKTDLVSLRADSLKATKRRSWAASEGTMSEFDSVRRVLLEQQLRGRSHYIPEFGIPSIGEETSSIRSDSGATTMSSTTLGMGRAEEQDRDGSEVTTTSSCLPSSSSLSSSSSSSLAPSTSAAADVERPTCIGGVQSQMPQDDATTSAGEENDSLCSTRSSEEAIELEIPRNKERPVKGILRARDAPSKGRRIEFDPLALLLDAALEGEIDLVTESAAKLSDVSASNDEGITALHNAICAGHYEIVRFLIDANADVNAQDSDGWTPLHCAASCNNLPMVRVLVEGGACVLASTLSDLETPVEKCEEEEDGYDGCLRYLLQATAATGSANGGVVYAAYSYAAEREDELSFEGGEKLRVVEKDNEIEKGWWRCEKVRDDGSREEGLAPRTYLALYPPLKYRRSLGFVPFDFFTEANNNEKDNNKQ